jgi:glycerophosphoryl diester phosphodiesterase
LITDELKEERKSILKKALGADGRVDLAKLSDRRLNALMANVFDGDRSALATLGFADRDMARLRDVHLRSAVVHISGNDIRGLGSKKVFEISERYDVEVVLPDPPSSPDAIPFERNAWRNLGDPVVLPSGVSRQQVEDFGRRVPVHGMNISKELVAHRGAPIPAAGILDNSLAAIMNALDVEGLDSVELDVVTTRDGRVVVHHDLLLPFNDKRISKLHSRETIGQRMVLREVAVDKNGRAKFTGRYSNSEQHVLSVESVVDLVVSLYPKARIYLDCRMKTDTGPRVAYLSRLKEAHENFVLKLWHFGFKSAEHMEKEIEKAKPRSDWKKNVKIAPLIDVNFVRKLCTDNSKETSAENMIRAGYEYLDGFLIRGFNVELFEIAICGLGKGYRDDGSGHVSIRKPDRTKATDPEEVKMITADYALMQIAKKMRARGFRIMTSFRTGDFLHKGAPYWVKFPGCTELTRSANGVLVESMRGLIGEAQRHGDVVVVDAIQREKILGVCREDGISEPFYGRHIDILEIDPKFRARAIN